MRRGTADRIMLKIKPPNLDALEESEPYDVCIVGSGPAGSVLASTLVKQGVRTIILESGNSIINWLADARLKQLAEYVTNGHPSYPLTRTVSRLVGGNSNWWTGRCERFHPSDFEEHPYTPTDNPWPIRFSDLEPFYERAEQTLRVRGGVLSHYAPPRKGPLPLPACSDISELKERMAQIGVTLDDSPTATPARAWRFFRVQNEILPRVLSSPHAALVSGVTATRLVHDRNNLIVGAQVKTFDGQTKIARARVFVVCCGGMQTPRLLLLSKSERFPEGIGNNCDRVGRGFNEHPGFNFYGTITPDSSTLAPKHKIGRSHQFYEKFRPEGLGSIHMVVIQSWVFPNHLLRYRMIDMPKHMLKIISRLIRPTLYMSPTLEMKPADDNRVTLSKNKTDPLGDPVAHLTMNFSPEDRMLAEKARSLTKSLLTKAGATDIEEIEMTWSRHHLGSCRMGHDPKTSVVDRNLRVHDCPNLYLCGAETFVTGAAVQPVLTITALAHRLGDHLPHVLRHSAAAAEPAALLVARG
jgi:glucose dehydrogenase